ncbi:peptidase, partial [Pseudomonas aeruginosa]
STIGSFLSVGMPLDLLDYHRDCLILPEGYRVTEDVAYFSAIRRQWSAGLLVLLEGVPSPHSAYNI